MALRLGLMTACAMLVTVSAQAQDAFKRDWLKSQFSGWDGIAFYCELSSGSGPTAQKLCDWASQRVRILARQSGAPLTVLSSDMFERYAQRRQMKNKPIDLVLAIVGTRPGPGAAAVHVAVRAIHAAELPPDARSTGPKPRSGTLVMWETEVIAAGMPGSELDGVLQQAAESNLMKFLNDFADGQQ